MAVAAGELVIVVESDALVKSGLYATTWAGGASSGPWTAAHLDTSRREGLRALRNQAW